MKNRGLNYLNLWHFWDYRIDLDEFFPPISEAYIHEEIGHWDWEAALSLLRGLSSGKQRIELENRV